MGQFGMSTFTVEMPVAAVSGGRQVTVEALVDTGATHSCLPSPLLRSLGIEPKETSSYRLADKRRLDYSVGEARVWLDGRDRVTPVVFGDEGTDPLLGAVTLEEFGLAVDPVNKRLIRVDGLLL